MQPSHLRTSTFLLLGLDMRTFFISSVVSKKIKKILECGSYLLIYVYRFYFLFKKTLFVRLGKPDNFPKGHRVCETDKIPFFFRSSHLDQKNQPNERLRKIC